MLSCCFPPLFLLLSYLSLLLHSFILSCHIAFRVCLKKFVYLLGRLGHLIRTAQFVYYSFIFLCLNWWLVCFLTAELHWNEWSQLIIASGFNRLAVSSQCHNLMMIFKCHGLVARQRYTQDGTGSLSQSTTLRREAGLMLMFCLLLLENWVICSARGCFQKMSRWLSRMKSRDSKWGTVSSFKRA